MKTLSTLTVERDFFHCLHFGAFIYLFFLFQFIPNQKLLAEQ